LLDVAARIRSFLNDLPHDGSILVVGHDATVLMLRAVLEGLTENAAAALMAHEPVRNASVSGWRLTGERWTLDFYNDVNPCKYTDSSGGHRP
jgi:broad specificity phosphatase PhoE